LAEKYQTLLGVTGSANVHDGECHQNIKTDPIHATKRWRHNCTVVLHFSRSGGRILYQRRDYYQPEACMP
jgi:hypothetical protein